MKKVIDVPPNQVDDLKKIAFNAKTSFKAYLEGLIQEGIKARNLKVKPPKK